MHCYAFASALNNEAQQKELFQQARSGLSSVAPSLTLEWSRGAPQAPLLCYILTGGTERQVLDAVQHSNGPVVLLAHPRNNSLAAALEIRARLLQDKRASRLVLLNGEPHGNTELQHILQVLTAHRSLSRRRVALIGGASEWLISSRIPALPSSLWPVELVELPMEELTTALRDQLQLTDHEALQTWQGAERSSLSEEVLQQSMAVYRALQTLMAQHQLDAFSLRCFDVLERHKITGCLALAKLNDEGCIAGCEGDFAAALTMLWMSALSGSSCFMANPQDISASDNILELAHCTIAPSLCSSYRLMTHFESDLGAAVAGELAAKEVTVARIGGQEYAEALVFEGEALPLQFSEQRCRTQTRVRCNESVSALLERPLGNHLVLCPGHIGRLCRFYIELFQSQ